MGGKHASPGSSLGQELISEPAVGILQPMKTRPISFKKSHLPHAEGSCLVTMGKTQVLCVATVEDKAPDHAKEKNRGWVTAEYAMLPRSGENRTSRSKASTGGRALEISRLVGRSLRAAVSLEAIAPYSIIIDCDVIRADGGTRTASINGGFVALVEALKGLYEQGKLAHWPLKNYVGAVSLGVCGKKVVVDMSFADDKNADVDFNLVMTESGGVIELQATSEGQPLALKKVGPMLSLGRSAIASIIKKQKSVLGRLPKPL